MKFQVNVENTNTLCTDLQFLDYIYLDIQTMEINIDRNYRVKNCVNNFCGI